MCDKGRLENFKFVNDKETRVTTPLVRPIEGGILSDDSYDLTPSDWDNAIARVISEIKNYTPSEIGFIASPYTTLENNYILKRFAEEVVGTDTIVYIQPDFIDDEDGLLIKSDKSPNLKGLELLGIKPYSDEFGNKVHDKKLKLVYIIHDSLTRLPGSDELMKNIDVGIIHISNFHSTSKKATVIFPSTTYAEMNGTFVNFQGRIQRIHPAIATIEEERLPGDFSMSRLDKFGAHNDRWTRGFKYNARPVWRVLSQIANALGNDFNFKSASDVFDDISHKVPAFSGLNYSKIGSSGILLNVGVEA
jgi:NADH-quinone oxidoreductase subunit G